MQCEMEGFRACQPGKEVSGGMGVKLYNDSHRHFQAPLQNKRKYLFIPRESMLCTPHLLFSAQFSAVFWT